MAKPEAEVIEAAGGLVWRVESGQRLLAVVHRRRYDDWTLPKGKRKPGESWTQTALREVREETGLEVRLEDFAGCICYPVKAAAKIVLFWHMTLTGSPDFSPEDVGEVQEARWLTVEQALARFQYADERKLVQEVFHDD